MANTLTTSGITVRFKGLTALEDINLQLKRGEILGLLGPNGAGKTTLVNVLSGFARPSSGSVKVDGEDITGLRPDILASRKGVVRTFQSVRLFPRLSVRKNVEVAVAGQKTGSGKHDAVMRALEFVGLTDVADKLAGSLPYTRERLVGIARALAMNPEFLMLDEPAAGMNDQEGAQLVQLIRRIPQTFGCGVLLIEHNMPVVMALCEQLHVLRSGKTLATGAREDVRRNRAVIESYLGTH